MAGCEPTEPLAKKLAAPVATTPPTVAVAVMRPAPAPAPSDDTVTSASPEKIYPGASKVLARCRANRVIAVQVELSKGSMGSEASREAFSTLKGKYKLVAGGAMPSLGNGYARFAAGKSVIEQDAPHLSFEFTITYYEQSFYDQLMSNSTKEKQETANRKKSAL